MDWFAYCAGLISGLISTVIYDEYKRRRDKKDEANRLKRIELNDKLKNHAIIQIVPSLEKFLNIYLDSKSYGNIRFDIWLSRIPNSDELYNESLTHLSSYSKILSLWKNINNLSSQLNNEINEYNNSLKKGISHFFKLKIPYLEVYNDKGREPNNYINPMSILLDVIFRRLHEESINQIVDIAVYRAKKEADGLWLDGHRLCRCKEEDEDLMINLLQELAYSYDTLFPQIKDKIKSFKEKEALINNQINEFDNELKLTINQIKVGEPLKGKCSICRTWHQ